MSDAYAITLASLHQDMVRLDRVASNLANVSTPGYKRVVVAVQPFADVVEQGLSALSPSTDEQKAASMASGVMVDGVDEGRGVLDTRSDMRTGALKTTGEPLDVALESEGWFEVATPTGPAYTRQGAFHADAQGRLVTAQGYPVMGKGGEIRLTTSTPKIDATGVVTEPDATFAGAATNAPGIAVGQLTVVRFAHPKRLNRLGDGLVAPGPDLTMADDADIRIREGALEGSNVNSMDEMLQLMRTMRHFESMQKIAQGYDEMLGTALTKLGDLS